jgi:hypothetical protein
MGQSVFPAPASGKTRYATTLLSGTTYTVPTGVTYLNVTLYGGGGGGGGGANVTEGQGQNGIGGSIISSTLSVTPGASITYAIGAGGAGGVGADGDVGGTTTFTGATSAGGGTGGRYASTSSGRTSQQAAGLTNAGTGAKTGTSTSGGGGGSGKIDIEYWL